MECCGKLCYSTRSQANHAKGFMRRERQDGSTMQAYRCVHGNGWHLKGRVMKAQNQRFKMSRAVERQDLQFAREEA